MAEIKAGAPFGMDGAMLSKIDWTLALKRVSQRFAHGLYLRAAPRVHL